MIRVLVAILGVLVVVSAIHIVLVRHDSRKLFVQVQALQERQDELREEWSRLLLEQATWGGYARVEMLAGSKLGMAKPEFDNIMWAQP